MLGWLPLRGCSCPFEGRRWPLSVVPWRPLESFFVGLLLLLLLLEEALGLGAPVSGFDHDNSANNRSVNIYMSVDELNRLLGMENLFSWGGGLLSST